MIFMPGFRRGNAPVICDYQAKAVGGSGTVVTFAAQPLGVAAGNRYVVVGFASANGGAALSSATIGGIAATIITQVGGSGCVAGLIIAAVPTGTTGDVVLTFASSNDRVCIAIYRLTSVANPAATDTATAHDTDPLLTSTLDILGGGAAIAVAVDLSSNSFTWTGLNEDTDGLAGSNGTFSAAHALFSAATSNLTVKADQLGDTRAAMAVASWH